MPNTEEVSTAYLISQKILMWKEYLDNNKIPELIEKGSAVLKHNKLEVQKIIIQLFITNWNINIGYKS